jgi:HTH-type transcriptional regulator/antitoxin HigA
MATANDHPLAVAYKPGTVTQDFLRQIAQLSPFEDGPKRAKGFLAKRGIALEVVPHLPRTHLDGAALRLAGGRPVIGLTLRYDRIDNFWFCLLHELAHVGLHMDSDGEAAFVDDHTLRDVEDSGQNPKEAQADQWAEEALVPEAAWDESVVRESPTGMAVINIAHEIGVHPAIVAGRVRHERGNYRLLSQFVGTGQVRRQFAVQES